ncbi:MAG: hypothetical protein WAU78_13645 [Roseiarcus sp.]|jgi:hypothetical protein
MNIEFDEAVTWDSSLLRNYATVEGRRVECMAGIETIAELEGHAYQSRNEIAKDKLEIARLLHPYWVRKIEDAKYDDFTNTRVTLLIGEI